MAVYEISNYFIHLLLIAAAAAQLIPAYFALRVYSLNGYARYWSESWIVFALVMLWIGLRRGIMAYTYDTSCAITFSWLFDQVISTGITSSLFTVFAILEYKFFTFWFYHGVVHNRLARYIKIGKRK